MSVDAESRCCSTLHLSAAPAHPRTAFARARRVTDPHHQPTMCSCPRPQLFTGEDEIFAFRRALSRLREMQSIEYLARSGDQRAGVHSA